MTDCGDLGTCVIPMWVQYVALAVAVILFVVKVITPHDPYDRM